MTTVIKIAPLRTLSAKAKTSNSPSLHLYLLPGLQGRQGNPAKNRINREKAHLPSKGMPNARKSFWPKSPPLLLW